MPLPATPGAPSPDRPPSPLKWLYLDFNSYFASVEQQLQPHLRGRPVVVVPVMTDRTCAIAASYEAKAYGVKTGTPIWEARKLCPDIVCVLARHDTYVRFHERAIEEINRHIPVSAVCSIDEMAVSLMRNESEQGTAEAIARTIKAGLKANLGPWLRCSIGVAPNRYLAKVACDLEKPDGLTVLMPDEIEPRLCGELALDDLPGIGRNMKRRLNLRGIHTIADVMALDRRQMRVAWGNIWGERMWYLLRGYDLPELETQRRSIGHSHVMAPEMRPPARAIDVARRLVLKAAARMRRLNYTASRFSFSARTESGQRFHREVRCRQTRDSLVFLDMLLVIWRDFFAVDGVGGSRVRIKKISVVLYGLVPVGPAQPDLFDRDAGVLLGDTRGLRLSQAMDRLNHRFGRDTVLVGLMPSSGKQFSGTKIAFTRIPDMSEFRE